MAKRKRNILDDLATRVRELLEDIERLLNAGQPKRVPVPVPARIPRSPRQNPYR